MVKFHVKYGISRLQMLQELTIVYSDERMSKYPFIVGISCLRKGGLGAPCWQMDKIVQNTCVTFVAHDDSHTLEEIAHLLTFHNCVLYRL